MAILLRRALSGYRTPRGQNVLTIQTALADDRNYFAEFDEIFGERTETGLKEWQRERNLPDDGVIDEVIWRKLVQTDPPSLFERCLELTAAFEGHGYSLAVGNWDGAYLTWGIIGFTLKSGNLGKVILRVEEQYPALLDRALGPDKRDDLLGNIAAPKSKQKQWADSIMIPQTNSRLRQDWDTAFRELGAYPAVRNIQREIAREIYWSMAERDFNRLGLSADLDMALMFDTAVQNGGINEDKATLVQERLDAMEQPLEPALRRAVLANAIADSSSVSFREDVRNRRLTIARGEGDVHSARYRLSDWGLHDAADAQTNDQQV